MRERGGGVDEYANGNLIEHKLAFALNESFYN